MTTTKVQQPLQLSYAHSADGSHGITAAECSDSSQIPRMPREHGATQSNQSRPQDIELQSAPGSSAQQDKPQKVTARQTSPIHMNEHKNSKRDPYRNPISIPGSSRNTKILAFPCSSSEFTKDETLAFSRLVRVFIDNLFLASRTKSLDERQILFKNWMCGDSQETASPAIVVLCKKSVLSDVQAVLTSAHIVEAFNIVATSSFAPRHMFRRARTKLPDGQLQPQLQLLFLPKDEPPRALYGTILIELDLSKPPENLMWCGSKVISSNQEVATLACILELNGLYFGLTTAHAFQSAEELSRGTTTSLSDPDASYDTKGLYEYLKEIEFRGRDSFQVGSNLIIPESFEMDLDWALVPLAKDWFNSTTITPSTNLPDLPSLGDVVSNLPDEEKEVLIYSTTKHEPKRGMLLCSTTYSGSLYRSLPVRTWSVEVFPSQELELGDSGSLVVDTVTSEIYGYVIGIDFPGYAQVIPLVDVLDQMRYSYGVENVSVVKTVQTGIGAKRGPTHTPEEWEMWRQRITSLYLTPKMTLQVIRDTLAREGFDATLRGYKRKIKLWELERNIRPGDIAFQAKLARYRDAANDSAIEAAENRELGASSDPLMVKALQAGDRAVVCDNANQFAEAAILYQEACSHFDKVINQTMEVADRENISKLRDTYKHRLSELEDDERNAQNSMSRTLLATSRAEYDQSAVDMANQQVEDVSSQDASLKPKEPTKKEILELPRRTESVISAKRLVVYALKRANNAVALDNAGKKTEAAREYEAACRLLQQIVLRKESAGDEQKLTAIRKTYENRIAELRSPGSLSDLVGVQKEDSGTSIDNTLGSETSDKQQMTELLAEFRSGKGIEASRKQSNQYSLKESISDQKSAVLSPYPETVLSPHVISSSNGFGALVPVAGARLKTMGAGEKYVNTATQLAYAAPGYGSALLPTDTSHGGEASEAKDVEMDLDG